MPLSIFSLFSRILFTSSCLRASSLRRFSNVTFQDFDTWWNLRRSSSSRYEIILSMGTSGSSVRSRIGERLILGFLQIFEPFTSAGDEWVISPSTKPLFAPTHFKRKLFQILMLCVLPPLKMPNFNCHYWLWFKSICQLECQLDVLVMVTHDRWYETIGQVKIDINS